MEDKNKLIDDHETTPQIGSGAMLAAARKEQNKSIEDIADQLNLSQTQIRTIELDQSEGLPEPTYVRGYIRSYAKLLGLDAEEVLEHYLNKNWQKSTRLDDLPRGIGDVDHAESNAFSPAKVIVFLMIVGAIGFFWWSGGLDRLMGKTESGSEPTQLSEESSQTPSQNVSSGSEISAATSLSGFVDSVSVEPSSVAADASTDQNQTLSQLTPALALENSAEDTVALEPADATLQVAADQSPQTRLILTFSETSWVDIRDEKQNRLAYQSYPAEETLRVSAEGILSVLIGNAKGVQMTLNGQPYDLSQHTEGVYAKFSVGTPQ